MGYSRVLGIHIILRIITLFSCYLTYKDCSCKVCMQNISLQIQIFIGRIHCKEGVGGREPEALPMPVGIRKV